MTKKKLTGNKQDKNSSPVKKQCVSPSAAELGAVFAGSSGSRELSSQEKADVELMIPVYNSDGSIYGAIFEAEETMVMHCLHRQKPNVWYKAMSKLNEHITERHEEDDDFPIDRASLEACLRCKFVFTKGEPLDADLHNLYVPWRVAVYVNKRYLKDVVTFLDGFICWRCTTGSLENEEFQNPMNIKIQLPVGYDLELTKSSDGEAGDMDCSFTLTYSDVFEHVKVTDAPPPCYPARMLIATIEAPSKNTVSIVWSGNSLPFKDRFVSKNIGGKEVKKQATDKYGEYYRKVENRSIMEGSERDSVLDLFGESLTRNSPVVVKLRSPPADDDVFQSFLADLKKLANCFFV